MPPTRGRGLPTSSGRTGGRSAPVRLSPAAARPARLVAIPPRPVQCPSSFNNIVGLVAATVACLGSWVIWWMRISFARHQFPPSIIRHAVWLYVRFTLSYHDVEDLLRSAVWDVSYETVRRWVLKGAHCLPENFVDARPTPRWHPDEMAVMIAGQRFWLWRAVHDEGQVLGCSCNGGTTRLRR